MSKTDPLILVGRVAGAFGVRGEVRISAFTADPMTLKAFKALLKEDGSAALTLTAARPHKDGIVARTPQIETPEQADALRGLRLYVPRSVLPEPEEDEFYLADLVGLEAATPEGERLGVVKAVQDFGAGDILEIDPGSGRPSWYLPFTRDCVPDVDIAAGRLTAVRPVEVDEKDGQ
ncbi:MAG TPA: ribosome maturation factor RimM [Caulobacteraceae bacterium]